MPSADITNNNCTLTPTFIKKWQLRYSARALVSYAYKTLVFTKVKLIIFKLYQMDRMQRRIYNLTDMPKSCSLSTRKNQIL